MTRSDLAWWQNALSHWSPKLLVFIFSISHLNPHKRVHLNCSILECELSAYAALPADKRGIRRSGYLTGFMHRKAGERRGPQYAPIGGGSKVTLTALPETAVVATVAVASGAIALLLTRSKPSAGGIGGSPKPADEDAGSYEGVQKNEEDPDLPADVLEALEDFDGDFSGPWHALGLEPVDGLTAEEIRVAYRQAVRAEHPDTSGLPDAEKRFQRVRKAYAILTDESTKVLLLEALFKQAGSLAELKALEEEETSSRDERPFKLIAGLSVVLLLAAGIARLTSPDMKLRSLKQMQRVRPGVEIQEQMPFRDSSESR